MCHWQKRVFDQIGNVGYIGSRGTGEWHTLKSGGGGLLIDWTESKTISLPAHIFKFPHLSLSAAAPAPAPFSINITPAGSPIYSQVSCNLIAGWWPSLTRSSTAIMQRPVKIRYARHKLTRTGVRYMYVAHLALDIHTYSLSLSLPSYRSSFFPNFLLLPPSMASIVGSRPILFLYFFFVYLVGERGKKMGV